MTTKQSVGAVVNIRGCSGAGKTTLVRRLMDAHGPAIPIARPGYDRYEGYQLGSDLRIVGDARFRHSYGGAEGMPAEDIERVVREYARDGSVIFEGLFLTEQVTRWRQLAVDLGNVTFAFLRPPVDVCIQRVLARRAEKGTTRPFKPERLRATWGRLALHHRAFEPVARCVWLPWEDPLPALETILWPAGIPALATM